MRSAKGGLQLSNCKIAPYIGGGVAPHVRQKLTANRLDPVMEGGEPGLAGVGWLVAARRASPPRRLPARAMPQNRRCNGDLRAIPINDCVHHVAAHQRGYCNPSRPAIGLKQPQ